MIYIIEVLNWYPPIYFESFDFELVVGQLRPPSGPTVWEVFKVPDPQSPAWRHAQIA